MDSPDDFGPPDRLNARTHARTHLDAGLLPAHYRELRLVHQERAEQRRRGPVLEDELAGELQGHALRSRLQHRAPRLDGEPPVLEHEGQADVVPVYLYNKGAFGNR